MQIFFPFSNMIALAVDAFGVLVFSAYIVYDTSKLDTGVWGPVQLCGHRAVGIVERSFSEKCET